MKDVPDWLKYAQSETTGIKLGLSTMDPTEVDASIEAAWQQSVEEEVNRRSLSEDSPSKQMPMPGVRLVNETSFTQRHRG